MYGRGFACPCRFDCSLWRQYGYLHAVDLNTGAYRGKRALGAPVFSSVAVSGNCLFVADFGGNIYNFKLHN